MNNCCPCCNQKLPDTHFYVRWYVPHPRRFFQGIREKVSLTNYSVAFANPTGGVTAMKADVVGLQTGILYLRGFDKALPDWLEEPTKRAIIAANGDLPPLYAKDRKKPSLTTA